MYRRGFRYTNVAALMGGPQILLSNSTISEDAANGAAIGELSVIGGSGTYTFTVEEDPDSVFTVDLDDLEKDGVLDYETSTSHQVRIKADNGAGSVVYQWFTITVLDAEEGFDPGAFATVIAWHRASDIVGSDNDPISTWADTSGNGRDITAAGAARPTLKTGIVNGKAVARFAGAQRMASAADYAASQPCTALIVFKLPDIASLKYLFSGRSGFGCAAFCTDNFAPNNNFQLYAGASDVAKAYPYDAFVLGVGYYNGASGKIGLNNDATTTTNIGTNAVAGLTLGDRYLADVPITGDIAEIMLLEGDVRGGANWADFWTYFSTEYGLS